MRIQIRDFFSTTFHFELVIFLLQVPLNFGEFKGIVSFPQLVTPAVPWKSNWFADNQISAAWFLGLNPIFQ